MGSNVAEDNCLVSADASSSKSPVGLQEIENRRIRNLVRGALSAETSATLRKTMETLRKQCSVDDAAGVFRFLHESPLAKSVPTAAPYPDELADINSTPIYSSDSLEIELVEQRVRFESDIDRLVASIDNLGKINRSILSKDEVAIRQNFIDFNQTAGLSLTVAYKAISLRHSSWGSAKDRFDARDILAPFLSPTRQNVAVAFEDSVDQGREYRKVRRTFLDFVSRRRLEIGEAAIIADVFAPLELYHLPVPIRVQAFGRWHVLDTLGYLMRLSTMFELAGRQPEVDLINASIPERALSAWSENFRDMDLETLQEIIWADDQFFDRNLFIHLPAWSEYRNLLLSRISVEAAIGERLSGAFPVKHRAADTIADPENTLAELLAKYPAFGSEGAGKFEAGAFRRTAALIASIEAGSIATPNGEDLNQLLDQTLDVAFLLSEDELRSFLPRKSDDALYEYLRTALLNDVEPNKINNHAVRRALQRLVIERFDGDIVNLLKYVDSPDGHVSFHLYALCSEAFLTELYDLYDQTDQVTEAQTKILEWHGVRRNDDDAMLRARSHRLNLRLRKVRGAIEDTRIYVDPLRFIQWVQDEVGSELRSLADFSNVIIEDDDQSTSLADQVQTEVQPRLRLLKVLDRCYHEFCTNKIYGVTSFIGRRVRHGTLHGHLVLELMPTISAAIDDCSNLAPAFADYLKAWLKRFEVAVLAMATDGIHVRSKDKPKGLIVAKLDESEKNAATNFMLRAVAESMTNRSALVHSPGLINEYCWLVLKVDLERVRDAVEGLRRDFVIQVDEHRCGDRPDVDQQVVNHIRSINSEVQRRFETVRSWLTRPTNFSPSASISLLVEAVLGEVRQRYSNFSPRLDPRGSVDIDLIGHRFHLFYDALYILVDNAARHGDPNGVLGVLVESDIIDQQFNELTVSIRSDIASANFDEAKRRIDEAMCAEVGDAMVQNQSSGIRKLRGLVEDVKEIVGFHHRFEGTSVIFSIRLRYLQS